jgi:hypothetical protein
VLLREKKLRNAMSVVHEMVDLLMAGAIKEVHAEMSDLATIDLVSTKHVGSDHKSISRETHALGAKDQENNLNLFRHHQ